MLALGKVKEVERLLAEGKLSYRRIAAALRVSRSTVSAIAQGKRRDYEARILARQLTASEPLGPIERCGTCGGRVYMPCRLCQVRKLKAAEQDRLLVLRRQARREAAERLLAAVRRARSG
jgi:hypothetical protein